MADASSQAQLGAALRRLRENGLQLSREALAAPLGVDYKSLAAYEYGSRGVPLETLLRLFGERRDGYRPIRHYAQAQRLARLNRVRGLPTPLSPEALVGLFGPDYRDAPAIAPVERLAAAPWVDRPELRAGLDAWAAGAPGTAVLEGPLGAGTTHLALAWAGEQEDVFAYRGVYWLEADGFESRHRWLHARVGVGTDDELARWLGTRRALLVVDDPRDRVTLAWLLGLGAGMSALLLTTARSDWLEGLVPVARVRVRGLGAEAGRRLLASHLGPRLERADPALVGQVGALLGWNPKSLSLLAGWAREVELQAVLEALLARLEAPVAGEEAGLEHALAAVYRARDAALSEGQRAALRRLSCLGRTAFDVAAARLVLGPEAALRLAELVRLGLVEPMREPDGAMGAGERFRLDWMQWRLARTERQARGEPCAVRYAAYPGLLYAPAVWWRPTLPGRAGLRDMLTDRAFWLPPPELAGSPHVLRRLFAREGGILARLWSQEAAFLPFEELATAHALRERAAWFQSWRGYGLVVVGVGLPAVLSLLAGWPLWAMLALAVLVFAAVLYPVLVHEVNSYRFLRRWLPRRPAAERQREPGGEAPAG